VYADAVVMYVVANVVAGYDCDGVYIVIVCVAVCCVVVIVFVVAVLPIYDVSVVDVNMVFGVGGVCDVGCYVVVGCGCVVIFQICTVACSFCYVC